MESEWGIQVYNSISFGGGWKLQMFCAVYGQLCSFLPNSFINYMVEKMFQVVLDILFINHNSLYIFKHCVVQN